MKQIQISTYTLSCALGAGMDTIRESIAAQRSGLTNEPWPGSDVNTWLGRVAQVEELEAELPDTSRSRNNQLALVGLNQDGFRASVQEEVKRHGAARVGLVLGTSTSSIDRTEASYGRLKETGGFAASDSHAGLHNPHSTGAFVAGQLGIAGPVATISTACSSSARAFATASRWLLCGLADAVVVGGVDSICLSVIYGFSSLQLTSADPCIPFDVNRKGLSLGEAAGFALLKAGTDVNSSTLLGYGESLDAHHMSSAHPEGLGAKLAMRAAAEKAGVGLTEIDYLNLHGTGTRANDDIENLACVDLLGERTRASSTKSLTGHTLGAAGITEAVLTLDTFVTGIVPGTIGTCDTGSTSLNILIRNERCRPRYAMSNSFGFGGSNCCLIFTGPAQ